jgi:hypothetical protein
MGNFKRELPYMLVIAVCLFGGIWLSRHYPNSNSYLFVMGLGVLVAVWRAYLQIEQGLRGSWRQHRP